MLGGDSQKELQGHSRTMSSNTHSDLVDEDLGRRPMDACVVTVDPVDHESTSAANVVNGVIGDLLRASGLDLPRRAVRLVA